MKQRRQQIVLPGQGETCVSISRRSGPETPWLCPPLARARMEVEATRLDAGGCFPLELRHVSPNTEAIPRIGGDWPATLL